jgi:predicted O-methyltransferase YrrM
MNQSFVDKMLRHLVRAYLSVGTFAFWQKWGFHVLPVHFYSPIPDTQVVPEETWQQVADLSGRINLRPEAQRLLLAEVSQAFREEYDAFPPHPTDDPQQFYTSTRSFNCVDAQMLYAMIRHLRPRRIIEVGSGFSTLLINQAIGQNLAEHPEGSCTFTAIEPYPDYIIGEGARLKTLPHLSDLIQQKVQQVPLTTFTELEAGDVLFIDSSHTVRVGGDTLYEMLKVLPALQPGVIIHIHDVFLPYEYPRSWTHEWQWFWTEQYLLEAFLSYNDHFEVLWASQYMHRTASDTLQASMAAYDPDEQYMGSFWFKKIK